MVSERMDCLFLVCRYSSKMNLHPKSIDYFQIIKFRILKRRKVIIGQIVTYIDNFLYIVAAVFRNK